MNVERTAVPTAQIRKPCEANRDDRMAEVRKRMLAAAGGG
jgi:hypothetical protein